MTEPPHRPTSASLSARLAAMPPASVTTPPAARPRKRKPTADKRVTAEAPEAEAQPTAEYPARLSVTTTASQLRALRRARADDGIQVTARLRALIAAWMDDPELRRRIDRDALERWQPPPNHP